MPRGARGRESVQGPQEPGRGVYLARRIVALLIILLVLILLVPRACQALLGPGEEESSGPTVPETSVTEESTTGLTEETAQQGSTAGGGETNVEVSISETASGAGAGEEESVQALDMQAAADLTGTAVSFEAPITPISESAITDMNINQPAPLPEVGLQQQEVVQPVTFEEPVFFEESPFFEEPMFLEEAVTPEEPTEVSEGPMASVSAPAPTSSGPITVIDSHQ
jgi:hypothetical protein